MSDRMAAEIWIGGRIPKRLVPQLCGTICTEGISLDWDESLFAPNNAADLLEGCGDEGGTRLLHLCNVEACWGEFGELEEFLVRRKISFRRRSEAKYEHDAQIVEFRPGIEPVRYPTDSSGKPYVPLADLIHAATQLDRAVESAGGKSATQLLSRLRDVRRLVKNSLPIVVPPLEPFEFVQEVTAKARPNRHGK
ncbi:MAG TPA: hypothetical protein VGM05_03615 [Planctomycetaceae bacterium]|jgi:hypothetical protein